MNNASSMILLLGVLAAGNIGASDWQAFKIPAEIAAKNLGLEVNIMEKGRSIALKEGDYLPDFGLINQAGKMVCIEDLRGKQWVLNFIFTRCQVAEMCPAATSRMAMLQREAPKFKLPDLHFVSITFDPGYDSPAVLRRYAQGFGIKEHNFDLLTYPKEAFIDSLLYLFGILTREENGTITHNSATFLIDATGRVALKQSGADWSAEKIRNAAAALSE
ncbi:MAG: SCO1 protein [Opitutia bacterium UBA7350]|nr:MAG: SCO1 protein [Opitutae bacterium UBA7350]